MKLNISDLEKVVRLYKKGNDYASRQTEGEK